MQQNSSQNEISPYIMVLGVAQDAGYPQVGCNKSCCQDAWEDPFKRRHVSCLAIVDPISQEQWIIDATPDLKFQLQFLEKKSKINKISGVFLTHAHIGHYTGLVNFGKEVMDYHLLPVFCMRKMKDFITKNAPWDQLVNAKNIDLRLIKNNTAISLNKRINITPFLVPHRDEYSETVGYKINTNNTSLIFIPDINKWQQWNISILEIIKSIDYAFLDGTFYKNGELNRDMSDIPHPFVEESMQLFTTLSNADKEKIHFTHFNHTNPLMKEESKSRQEVLNKGFKLAKEGQIIRF